jgi:hypothetical protein
MKRGVGSVGRVRGKRRKKGGGQWAGGCFPKFYALWISKNEKKVLWPGIKSWPPV